MDQISKQVSRAQQRLMVGQFFRILCWSIFAGLLIAAIGLAIPKIWHLDFLQNVSAQDQWNWSWIGGGLLLGLMVATGMTWFGRQSRVNAAIEVDRRFGLKERMSSAMMLDADLRETEVGRALVDDAQQTAETIDVRDQFGYQPTWKAALPLIPTLLLGALMFVPNAALDKTAVAKEAVKLNSERVKVAVEEAKKKFAKRVEEKEAKGLKDALEKLNSLEKKVDKLGKGNSEDKKDSLVKLNDIKKQLEKRQKELGSTNELKENLKKMQSVSKGPAKQLAEAMKSGDMKDAKKAIKELAEKLKKGQLSETEKKELAKDLQQMAKQLKQMAKDHEAAKEKLKEQIKQAQQEGDLDKAAELQQKLDEKNAQDKQKQDMQKLADKLQKCAECMKQGQKKGGEQQKQGQNPGGKQPGKEGEQQAQAQMEAQQALEDLAEQLENMEGDAEELKDLEDLSKSLEDIKNAMNDCECEGEGAGGKDGPPQFKDWAKGNGNGMGKRDRADGETKGYKSKVKGKLVKGETVVTGSADGNNISGKSVSEAREIVAASMSEDNDPLADKKLPKALREQARQYFEQVREGN